MTSILTPPPYAQAGSYTAQADRAVTSARWTADNPTTRLGPYSGVIPRATSIDFPHVVAGNTVTVGKGAAVVAGTEASTQYAYHVQSDGDMAFTPASAPAGQSIVYLIVLRVRDAFYSGASTDADMVLLAGTPAASNPPDPALPANSYAIKRIVKTASAAPVVTTVWEYQASAGGIIPARAASPTRLPMFAGQYRDDGAGRLQRGTSEGGAWETIASVAGPSTFTPELTNASGNLHLGSGGGNVRICYYEKIGRWVRVAYYFQWGTSPWSATPGPIRTQLPPGVTGAALEQLTSAKLYVPSSQAAGDGIYDGKGIVPSGSVQMQPYFPLNNDDTRIGQYQLATTANVPGGGVPAVGGYPQGGSLSITGVILTA